MRKEATIEQWKELYESATRLKSMKPWETFWDLDIIAVQNGEENDLTEGAEPSGAAGDLPESTEDIYGDLDQEAEGGWIEDLGEEEE